MQTSLRIYATFLAALLGLAFGSFLNVCLTRWPAGESILKPRSHCRACGRTLAWWENIPLVSWLALRGRCRTCGAWIGWRYPLVELALGTLWALAVWHNVPSHLITIQLDIGWVVAIDVVSELTLLWILLALAAFDLEHLWLPDKLTILGAVIGFAAVMLRGAVNSARVFAFYGALGLQGRFLRTLAWHRLLAMLAAALLILVIRWTYKLIRHREGIGLGDAKLMAMLAAWLGLAGALLSFVIGVTLGALTALVLLALPRTNAGVLNPGAEPVDEPSREAPSWAVRKLPLGTFLCIGGIVSALWGQPILAAYLRWAGF